MTGIEAALTGAVASETIELRTSQAGKRWAAFSVAVGDGDNRQYVRVATFGSLAERVAAEFKQWDKCYVEGHSLRLSEWQSRTGEKRTGLQMVGAKVEKVGTSAIGRNKPPRSKAPRQDEQPPGIGQVGGAARDWQRPADVEIPF